MPDDKKIQRAMRNLQNRFPDRALALFVLAAKAGEQHQYALVGPRDRVLQVIGDDLVPGLRKQQHEEAAKAEIAKSTRGYQVVLVWNREDHWCNYGDPHDNVWTAIKEARSIQNSGDGARVKKIRIVDEDDNIVWQYGSLTEAYKGPKET